MRVFLFFSFLFLSLSSQANIVDLNSYVSPYIEGDTLYIVGRIDSHIYDSFSRDAEKIKKVKYIELMSYGGNVDWAMQIAGVIKSLHKTTRLAAGGFCASACVPLFAAGDQRQMAGDAWIGIHAARNGANYIIEFDSTCKSVLADGKPHYISTLPGCVDVLARWWAAVATATDTMFTFYEENGVSKELRQEYLTMPLVDEAQWVADYNVMQTPDWEVHSDVAKQYNLATEIIQ